MFPLNFRLTTDRLVIRRMHPDDWQDLYAYLSDAETVYYEPYDVYSKEDARLEAANRMYGMKLFDKQDRPSNGEFIATVADKVAMARIA